MIDPVLLLTAYARGIFPMAETARDKDVFWVEPKKRGVLPLDGFHCSHSLARLIRKGVFTVSFDTDFKGVMEACADRSETWINREIVDSYCFLFEHGYAHSVECRDEEGLQGGLYGVSLGGAFFGESMFHRKTNASKVALAALVDRLIAKGFVLLDTQFLTPHLASLGGIEMPQKKYLNLLRQALTVKATF